MKSKEIRENEWLLEKFRKLKRQAIINVKHFLSSYVGKPSFSLMLSGVVFLITVILLLLSEDKDGNLANKAIYFLAAVALVLIQAVIFGNMAVLKRSVHTLRLISAIISLIVFVLFSVMFCYSASAITAFR